MKLLKAIYSEFSSTRLTLILLIVLAACMLLGTMFPQEGKPEEYVEAFGEVRAMWFTRLGLFDIFHSWYFLLAGGIFFLNIVFCSIDGWRSHLRPRAAVFKEASTARWDLGENRSRTILSALRNRGYRLKEVDASGGVRSFVAQRGLPSRPMSIIYHFGLALTFVGFVLSALTAFDGEVYLHPGETKKIPMSSPDMTVNRWRTKLGFPEGEVDSVSLHLESFDTEYTWYNLKYYPKDWKSAVTLTTASGAIKKKVIEVNAPLRHRGLTIYQMSYKQTFELQMEDTTIQVVAGDPFELPGFEGKFSVRVVRAGTLFKGAVRVPITPNADLYYKALDGEKGKRVGRLTVDARYFFQSTPLVMRNVTEASGLYFRRDDGVAFLYVAFILFMMGLFVRIFWPSYRVSLHLDEVEGKAYLSARVVGVAAYEDSELAALYKQFQEVTR